MIEYPDKYEKIEKTPRTRPRLDLTPKKQNKNHGKGLFLTGIQLVICVVVVLSAVLIRQFGGDFYKKYEPDIAAAINSNIKQEDVTQVFKNIGTQLPDAAEIFKTDSSVTKSSRESVSADSKENSSNGNQQSSGTETKENKDQNNSSGINNSSTESKPSGSSKVSRTVTEGEKAQVEAPITTESAVNTSSKGKTALEMKYLSLNGTFETPKMSRVSSENSEFKADSKRTFSPIKLSQIPIKPVIGEVTSAYGYRSNPVTGIFAFHTGMDIKAPEGEPIRAAFSGKVESVSDNATYGHHIVLDHSNGIKTMYAHCSEIVAKEGEIVKAGDTIAKVGSTGVATGNHLHFEITVNGVNYNPQWVV